MKRAWLLLLAACTLDAQGVIDHAALIVDAQMLNASEGTLEVTAVDSVGTHRSKSTRVAATEIRILFEPHSLADGPVSIGAELRDSAGVLIGCSTTRGTAGGDDNTVLLGFSSPSSDGLNCGTCGNRCEGAQATGECVRGQCAMASPDAGEIDAGIFSDAGMVVDAGTPDAGNCGRENDPASCSDGLDNDCDGKKDCDDSDCQNVSQPCGLDICAAGIKLWSCSLKLFGLCVPYIPVPENNALLCGNGLDDDCDGLSDCRDSSCTGRSPNCQ
jgi:hypothetical protein